MAKLNLVKKIIIVCLGVFVAAACTKKPEPIAHYTTPLTVGTHKLWVEIMDTDTKREQGLSGREKLADNQGMYFNFSGTNQQRPGFWMKDMKFNIDIIWIKNNVVVGITKNLEAPATASSTLPVYYPPADIDTALEVNAGWAEKYNIRTGDMVTKK